MPKIFEVELSSRNGSCTELVLPATPYAMLDAMEKLRLEDGEAPAWIVLSVFNCERIADFMDEGGSLFELNALCQQLALLDNRQLAIVEGLAKMEYDQNAQPVSLPRLIDMAYSTDRCHIVEGVITDAQLGRFCAENGFVPEADNLSDEAFELLDFARIGRDFRQNEGGVFTSGGYVQKHDELRQVYKPLDLTPKKPDYTILVEMSDDCQLSLPLPPGEPTWDEPVHCVDCTAPSLIGLNDNLATLDKLARQLAELEADGNLSKYKALLTAFGCDEVNWALDLTGELEQYSISLDLHEPDEVAGARLEQLLPDDVFKALLPHVQLYPFGKMLVHAQGSKLTEYGLIERVDGGPIQTGERELKPGGMELV